MIRRDEVIKIGQFNKPHALRGEINFSLHEADLFEDADPDMLIVETDGIFVPFFIQEYRFKNNDTGIVLLDGVTTDEAARELSNLSIYLHKSQTENLELVSDQESVIGFTVEDSLLGTIGEVISIDDTTLNVLLVVRKGDEPVYIPYVDEFINRIDDTLKTILTTLPEGLFDTNGETY